ncbi:unnamed protein product [Acanthoscelides obtectus]|uniref:Uncharacterized protein n=1 Tax=Acanthoscelides obtectus TaxID=200917 RepID=A0A9P0PWK3_ACAOB|nr:unnamed protein product [Acanthoscelides obtectus]CAK1673369.1 hypothetical protein AOBTE_LOCUS29311 [Acanthoscelides obtectus]
MRFHNRQKDCDNLILRVADSPIITNSCQTIKFLDTLAQELESERKSRQQQAEREVKSPLQDRSGYYKSSVMFTSSAT